ncbi:MAG: hypothetical protein ABIK68_08065 [bacterium]
MTTRKIVVIDLTIREGMQFRGLMFSQAERMAILEYQEALGVDVTQVGYPPAHASEARCVEQLFAESKRRAFRIHVTGLCRALATDVRPMLASGLEDFHLHTVFTAETLQQRSLDSIFDDLRDTIRLIRSKAGDACIEISLVDIGKTDARLLEACSTFLINQLKVDIITLPDTSGMMAPNRFFSSVQSIVALAAGTRTRIGVHCHNDGGMASANTVMGVAAGADVIQVSALGIGERNGLGDLFTVSRLLKEQGYQLNLRTEDIPLFRQYYHYIDDLCWKRTGFHLLNYNTPFFGQSMKTHVAGTHGAGKYGLDRDEDFYLNVLCGKHLVRKYLSRHQIPCDENRIDAVVSGIKNRSATLNRALEEADIREIVDRCHEPSPPLA